MVDQVVRDRRHLPIAAGARSRACRHRCRAVSLHGKSDADHDEAEQEQPRAQAGPGSHAPPPPSERELRAGTVKGSLAAGTGRLTKIGAIAAYLEQRDKR